MRSIKRVIRLRHQGSLSARQVAQALMIAKSTVCDYLSRYETSGLTLADLEALSEGEIYAALFPEAVSGAPRPPRKSLPDFALMHQELKKRHVTRQLLWEEYRSLHPDGYAYTQFCNLYRKWTKKLSISMRQIHKAGQKMFVDYSGLTAEVIDQKTPPDSPQKEIFREMLVQIEKIIASAVQQAPTKERPPEKQPVDVRLVEERAPEKPAEREELAQQLDSLFSAEAIAAAEQMAQEVQTLTFEEAMARGLLGNMQV